MSLGVGGSTTFTSKNNHQTAQNHSHRDMASKDVATCKTKAKCTSCGVWGHAGENCKLCKTAIPAPKVKPNWNQKVEPLSVIKKKQEQQQQQQQQASGEQVKK